MGVLHIGIYNGAYINICEYVHTKWKNHVGTVLLCCDMCTQIIIGFYWRYVSKNWLGLQLFAISLNSISLLGLYLTPESPEYLYSFYRFKELRAVIEKIGRWNKREKQLGDFRRTVIEDLKKSQLLLEESQSTNYSGLPDHYRFDLELDLK